MMRSPLSIMSASLAIVSRVGAPAGTMTQTTRGASSFLTIAAIVRTSDTLGSRSKPTTSWPARRRRSRMLPPIFPRPMRPSCMADPFETGDRRVPGDETATTNHDLRGGAATRTAGSGYRHCTHTEGGESFGSAGETHGHEDVSVAVV